MGGRETRRGAARPWYRHRLVWAAGLVCLLAWGRLALTTLTTSSPPREVTFYGPDGARLSARDWNCHRSAFVAGRYIWQLCYQDGGDAHFARFDLAAGRVDLRWPVADMSPRAAQVGAVARSAEEGGLVVAGTTQGVWILAEDGGIRSLDREGYSFWPCLRTVGGAIDLVYYSSPHLRRARWREGESWSELPFPQPDFGPETFHAASQAPDDATHGAEVLGCYFSRADPPGWRGVWIRFPRFRGDEDEVPVEYWSGGPGVEIQRIATHTDRPLRRGEDFGEREPMLGESSIGDLVLLQSDALDRTSGGGLLTWGAGRRLIPGESDLAPPEPPPDGRFGHDVDYLVGEDGLEVIAYAQGWPPRARLGDTWYGAISRPDLAFARLEEDAATPAAPQGKAAVHEFWVSSFSWLPDGEGGFWILGSLGEVFVHLDASLNRTDHLGFAARFARALRTDRAKWNSDFYYEHAWLKKGLFLWVLFAAPLMGLVLLVATRLAPAPPDRAARAAAWTYLVLTALAVPASFWKLSGVFW